jgi:predicted NACHT family NTPase
MECQWCRNFSYQFDINSNSWESKTAYINASLLAGELVDLSYQNFAKAPIESIKEKLAKSNEINTGDIRIFLNKISTNYIKGIAKTNKWEIWTIEAQNNNSWRILIQNLDN